MFERVATGEEKPVRQAKRSATCVGEKAYREFERAFFKVKFAHNIHEVNGVLYELPQDVFEWKGLNVLRVGVRLGEVKNGRFEPCHALAMSVNAGECSAVLYLNNDDARVEKYLRGETLDADVKNGWCLVCVDGYPIGLGKAVNGTLKNHLPKGLRKQ